MTTDYTLDEPGMISLAQTLAACMPWPLCVHLLGDLGASKTTLARAWLRALGHEGPVRSPTYSLVEPYSLGPHRGYHLDLYRLADPEELEFLGRDEWAGDDVLLLIEWPERGAQLTPPADVIMSLASADQGRQRRLSLKAASDSGRAWLRGIAQDSISDSNTT